MGAVERRKEGVGCTCCCSGELSGEPEEREPRSDDEAEWMDWSWNGVLVGVEMS